MTETGTDASITALLALVRQQTRSGKIASKKNVALDTPAPNYDGTNSQSSPQRRALQKKILASLAGHDLSKLTDRQRIDLLRVYALTFVRLGVPGEEARQATIAKLSAVFPIGDPRVDIELTQLLVYLQSDHIAAKGVVQLEQSPTQQEQIAYVKSLRLLREGWTPALRQRYFSWFQNTATAYAGGASFDKFIADIRDEAIAGLSSAEKTALKDILAAKSGPTAPSAFAGLGNRTYFKNYTVKELAPIVEKGLTGRNFSRGRLLFGAVGCFACHRFGNEGGAGGPDLTISAGRFSPRDLLESIIEPNKEISDQYGAMIFTLKDGTSVYGRIVNLSGDKYQVNSNMLDPKNTISVNSTQIESIKPSPISMMPLGLLNRLKQDEVMDLMAYLLSRGDRDHPMFK